MISGVKWVYRDYYSKFDLVGSLRVLTTPNACAVLRVTNPVWVLLTPERCNPLSAEIYEKVRLPFSCSLFHIFSMNGCNLLTSIWQLLDAVPSTDHHVEDDLEFVAGDVSAVHDVLLGIADGAEVREDLDELAEVDALFRADPVTRLITDAEKKR
ncbi:hypothetical protein L596_022690 [Steinernema carpocapsae]|uniref:Uncharacterized protein n=1 Tax=Steinernema carpocapsae TaxID=34508 RepID=A0A4U5MMJ5_STECR|nr:hypothetical protein L596_022690 [Steinernema carpocapsae]